MSERWHTMSVEDVTQKLDTDIYSGLKSSEAAARKNIRNDGNAFVFPQLSSKDATKIVINDVGLYFFFFLVATITSIFGMWSASLVAVVIVALNCTVTVFPRMLILQNSEVKNYEAICFKDIRVSRRRDPLAFLRGCPDVEQWL